MAGTLYIVGTPIGNLKDITLRAIETLKEADIIAAEDTRHTAKLLSHLDIHKKLISYHEHSGEKRTSEILGMIEDGLNIALVSDAGMPLVSDPGFPLMRACIDRDVPVAVVPGPSAVTSVVAISGLDCRQFVFGGFLSAKQTSRRKQLAALALSGVPIVLYESPQRVPDLIRDICDVLGPDVMMCAAKELTKIHETAVRGHARDVLSELNAQLPLRGEYAVVVEAHTSIRELEDDELRMQLADCLASGMSKRDAVQYASAVHNVPRKRAYKVLLDMEQNT